MGELNVPKKLEENDNGEITLDGIVLHEPRRIGRPDFLISHEGEIDPGTNIAVVSQIHLLCECMGPEANAYLLGEPRKIDPYNIAGIQFYNTGDPE